MLRAQALFTVFAVLSAAPLFAETPKEGEKKEEKKEEKKADAPAASSNDPEVVVTNLESPSGLAVHPTTGHVFVASRYGVYRYIPDPGGNKHQAPIEIAGYPVDVYGKGPMYNIGPLGLGFLDNDHLIVGDGSRKDGEELVRVYKIADKAPAEYQKEDAAVHTLGPIKKGDQTASGEGNFYGVAVGGGKIFITCNGDDTKGWIAVSAIADGKPGELKLTIDTKVQTEVDAPVPITFTPDGKELVVGQMGEVNVPGDSLLTFYDPNTGKLARKLKTGLHDLAGLAYSPKTGKLYATLYITAFGTQAKDSDKSPGTLQIIKAGL
jgi:DNA-binding beta-propeller fold protein YncE